MYREYELAHPLSTHVDANTLRSLSRVWKDASKPIYDMETRVTKTLCEKHITLNEALSLDRAFVYAVLMTNDGECGLYHISQISGMVDLIEIATELEHTDDGLMLLTEVGSNEDTLKKLPWTRYIQPISTRRGKPVGCTVKEFEENTKYVRFETGVVADVLTKLRGCKGDYVKSLIAKDIDSAVDELTGAVRLLYLRTSAGYYIGYGNDGYVMVNDDTVENLRKKLISKYA